MPAPAVIPAPIAYIKVVAVKKLVVGLKVGFTLRQCFKGMEVGIPVYKCLDLAALVLTDWGCGSGLFTLKKLGCSKQAILCLE